MAPAVSRHLVMTVGNGSERPHDVCAPQGPCGRVTQANLPGMAPPQSPPGFKPGLHDPEWGTGFGRGVDVVVVFVENLTVVGSGRDLCSSMMSPLFLLLLLSAMPNARRRAGALALSGARPRPMGYD